MEIYEKELIIEWNMVKAADGIQYRQLTLDEITPDLLRYFNRYQKVEKSWQNKDDKWVLVDSPCIMNWDEAKKFKLATDDFIQIIQSGGMLFCAFDENKLIGFCGLDGNFIGNNKQYLRLVYLHVSFEYRKKGIGRKLFSMVTDAAKKIGAKKLYISANSSQESQAFYRGIGCVDAEENMAELFEAEPFEMNMEYVL
ncbi:MAG: GNAT family N-acetyltransferase [Oscillospiraceae bacterium]|nr:GNAT family N-acetyltransferase [Oscillospiraceae bacterium]